MKSLRFHNAQRFVALALSMAIWNQTATVYMKTYMKLSGESSYTLKDSKTNYKTYLTNALNGQHGYIKWGLYIILTNTLRVVYHGDIRIIGLN